MSLSDLSAKVFRTPFVAGCCAVGFSAAAVIFGAVSIADAQDDDPSSTTPTTVVTTTTNPPPTPTSLIPGPRGPAGPAGAQGPEGLTRFVGDGTARPGGHAGSTPVVRAQPARPALTAWRASRANAGRSVHQGVDYGASGAAGRRGETGVGVQGVQGIQGEPGIQGPVGPEGPASTELACPPGFGADELTLNSPGGQVTMYTCLETTTTTVP